MFSVLACDWAELPEGTCALFTVPKLEEGLNMGNKPSGFELTMLIAEKKKKIDVRVSIETHVSFCWFLRSMVSFFPAQFSMHVDTAA